MLLKGRNIPVLGLKLHFLNDKIFLVRTIEELATSEACLPLNLSAWKIAFRSQSVQYIQSPKRVMLKGCLSISGDDRITLENKKKRKIDQNHSKQDFQFLSALNI